MNNNNIPNSLVKIDYLNKTDRLKYLIENDLPITPNDYLPNAKCRQCGHNNANDLILEEINQYLCMGCNIQNCKAGLGYYTIDDDDN